MVGFGAVVDFFKIGTYQRQTMKIFTAIYIGTPSISQANTDVLLGMERLVFKRRPVVDFPSVGYSKSRDTFGLYSRPFTTYTGLQNFCV